MSTSREIVNALMRNRPPLERMAVHDNVWADTLRLWADEQGYPRDAEGEPVPPHEHFGFDIVSCGGWIDHFPLCGMREVVEETDEWEIRRNGAGGLLKWWKNKSGTPEHIDFAMTSREIWERDYRSHVLEPDRERLHIDANREALAKWRAAGKWTWFGDQFIWENMRCMMGDVCMYESLALDPEWIHDYCRVYTDFFKTHYAILIEEAGKPDGFAMHEDLGYRNGLFCSPKILKELVFPYFAEFVDFWHSYDIPVMLHSCGNVREALPLIVDAGFDALNPMEVKAGCDVVEFAEEYGDRLAFVGGLDARILESGDRDLIRNEVVRLTDAMRRLGARFVLGSDHSLSTNVPYADFMYAVEVFRECCAY